MTRCSPLAKTPLVRSRLAVLHLCNVTHTPHCRDSAHLGKQDVGEGEGHGARRREGPHDLRCEVPRHHIVADRL